MQDQSARDFFIKVVEQMEQDNGCDFVVSLATLDKGVDLMQKLLDAGWKPLERTELPLDERCSDALVGEQYEPGVDWGCDLCLLAAGEQTEMEALGVHYGPNMQELSNLLNEIFDGENTQYTGKPLAERIKG